MKKYLFITCSLALVVQAATAFIGCSADADVDNSENTIVVSPEDVGNSVSVFFEEALPKDAESKVFFTDVPKDKDFCMVIDNEDELMSAYHGDEELPKIDFSNYSLVIGKLFLRQDCM